MKKITLVMFASLCMSLLANTSHAGVLLSDLISGNSLTVGDKVFSNWSTSDVNGDPVDLDSISIAGDNSNPLNPGLVYSFANGSLGSSDPDYFFYDFDISFTVSTSSNLPLIVGTSLQLTDATLGNSTDGLVSVLTTYTGLVGSGAEVYLDSFAGSQASDSLTFAGVASRDVNLNIVVFNNDFISDSVNLAEFRQYFAQSASVPAVPEPVSLATWSVLGLAGLGFSRRRRTLPTVS
ncbi:MAG: PEP-CTERM sorting domain-containing protein [Pirellulaceae bacterium]